MNQKKKAEAWVKNNFELIEEEPNMLELAFLAGYEQAEFDLLKHFTKLTFAEFTKRFGRRYDLQDGDK